MRISYRSNARQVSRAIEGIVAATVNDPIVNTPRYEALMRRGTDSHFRKLAFGGQDASALGGMVSWSRDRHPITMRRRRGQGFPLLDTGRSFLRRGFTDRTVTRAQARGREQVVLTHTSTDPRASSLGAVHQKGLPPLFASKQGFPSGFRVPVRQFLYWDRQMAAEAARELRRAFRQAKAGAGAAS